MPRQVRGSASANGRCTRCTAIMHPPEEVRSGAVALGVEAVALAPALHLLAYAADVLGDLADVALVLLAQRDALLAACIGRRACRRRELRGRDLFGHVCGCVF